jgi:hypothetical protein
MRLVREADCLDNVESLKFHNPIGPTRPVTGKVFVTLSLDAKE